MTKEEVQLQKKMHTFLLTLVLKEVHTRRKNLTRLKQEKPDNFHNVCQYSKILL